MKKRKTILDPNKVFGFKVGDEVVCLPGFSDGQSKSDVDPEFGGGGYKEGRVFIIRQITVPSKHPCKGKGNILWPEEEPQAGGIWECTVEYSNTTAAVIAQIKNEIGL